MSPLASWLASLSFVIDLANGSPDGTTLRGTYVASVAARELGVDPDEHAAAVVGALFRYLGCTGFAHEESMLLGDEHEAARLFAPHDKRDYAALGVVVARDLGADDSVATRAVRAARLAAEGLAFQRAYEASHCEGAALLAERLGVTPAVAALLGSLRERWDGSGGPVGVGGETLSLATRIVQIAREAVIHATLRGGAEAARACLARLAGRALDPVACARLAQSEAFFRAFDDDPLFDLASAAIDEAASRAFVHPPTLDVLAQTFGDFGDVKSPLFLGAARKVERVAVRAAKALGFDGTSLQTLSRAALLHDVGRVTVANRIWATAGPLDPLAWERVRLHAYYGERTCHALSPDLGLLVGQHHERADGSGYARGIRPGLLSAVLATTDHAVALCEARAHRAPYSRTERGDLLEREVAAGRLRGDVVRAVLDALDQRPSSAPPAGSASALSPRECDVLRLVARGHSNKEVASALGISARTVQAHTIHAYDKLGVRTRAGAALRAMDLGLLEPNPLRALGRD